VQNNIAQGNALGIGQPDRKTALKEQHNDLLIILPFQGEDNGLFIEPSPLGWAKVFWPFRP